jgi:mRNA interferase MazF
MAGRTGVDMPFWQTPRKTLRLRGRMSVTPIHGDFISLDFDPQSGHEQRGRRPALVVSNDVFNDRVGLAMVCLVTNTGRGWPLHVSLPAGLPVTGVVMVEQIKSDDYAARHAGLTAKARNPFSMRSWRSSMHASTRGNTQP